MNGDGGLGERDQGADQEGKDGRERVEVGHVAEIDVIEINIDVGAAPDIEEVARKGVDLESVKIEEAEAGEDIEAGANLKEGEEEKKEVDLETGKGKKVSKKGEVASQVKGGKGQDRRMAGRVGRSLVKEQRLKPTKTFLIKSLTQFLKLYLETL